MVKMRARDGVCRGTCRMTSGEDGDMGCDCDRGIMAAALWLRAAYGESSFVVLHSSKAGTPVKKNPGGGAEVLTRVLVAFMMEMHTLAHLRELLDASVLSDG